MSFETFLLIVMAICGSLVVGYFVVMIFLISRIHWQVHRWQIQQRHIKPLQTHAQFCQPTSNLPIYPKGVITAGGSESWNGVTIHYDSQGNPVGHTREDGFTIESTQHNTYQIHP